MSPREQIARVTLVALLSVYLTMCGGVPTAPTGEVVSSSRSTQTTMFAFVSDPGDIVGQGRSDVLTLQNAIFRASLSREGGRLTVMMQRTDVPPTDRGIVTILIISMPLGAPLTPGSYETTSSGDPARAGLYVSSGLACDEAIGHLIIHTIDFAPAFAALKELRASFDQHCSGAVVGLRGEIALLADPWR